MTHSGNDQTTILYKDEQGVMQFQGELSIHNLDSFQRVLTDMLDSDGDLILSLAEVTFMDVAALQLLLAFKNALVRNRSWRLVAVSERVERILSLSGLTTALRGQER